MVKRKLLIVDEPADARALTERLIALGYDVVGTATFRDEVVAKTEEYCPELVLMGTALSGDRSSLAVANDLQRRGRLPVIFMVAAAREVSSRRTGAVEPYSYVAPPFTDRELRGAIELALSKNDAEIAAEAMANRFFVGSIDMLCFLDFNGYFKQLNPAWEHTLGFTREELMAKPFIEFVHPDDRERTLAQNAEVRAGGRALAFENRYLCKDGSYRWLHWNAAPDFGGKVIYSSARDVTARKKAEAEREQLVCELQAALAEVKSLRAILPICSYCRKIRDDEDYWDTVENYVSKHTTTKFSHGICPSCMASEVEPALAEFERE